MASLADTTDSDVTTDYSPRFQHAIELIGRRWTGSILKVIGDRALRFGEITAAIPGLSDRLLDARLTELEAEGIVSRSINHGQIRYSMTMKGIELQPVFEALSRWAAMHAETGDLATRPGRRQDG